MEPSQRTPSTLYPKLNDDVLLFVLSSSSRQTATSMMATCHFLYHEGAKVVLHDWPLTFDSIVSERTALSLLHFVQAENFSRCSYVRKLFVSMQPMPAAIAQSLAGLLPRMTSLESLFLNLENALQSHPSLLSAFSSLQSVKDLIVNGAERSCALIQSLQSQLVSAQLYFSPQSPESGQRLYLGAAFHPLILLQRSALTLKTFTCGFWCDMDLRIFFSLPEVRYPSMHTFMLYECQNPQGLTPYMNCFPNLAHLTVDASLLPRNLTLAYASLAVIQRNMNLARQGPSPAGAALSWKQLHDYTGHLVELWLLGLACPIPCLNLEDTPPARPPHAFTDVIGSARPTQLTIAFRRCSLTDVLKADFLSALRTDGAANLRRLTFLIELRADDRGLDVGRALGDIEATISQLKLTHLDVRVDDAGLDEDEDEPDFESPVAPDDGALRTGTPSVSESKPPPLSQGERTLDAFDVEAIVWRLLRSVRTLQETIVSIQRPRRCGGAMRSRRVMTQGYEFTSSADPWVLPTLVVDSGSDSLRVVGLCRECAKELDTTEWWGEIAAANAMVGKK